MITFIFSDLFQLYLKGSELSYDIEVPGPPSVLELYNKDGGKSAYCFLVYMNYKAHQIFIWTRCDIMYFSSGEEVLYGTTDGKLGLVQIGDCAATTKWEIANEKKKGGIVL